MPEVGSVLGKNDIHLSTAMSLPLTAMRQHLLGNSSDQIILRTRTAGSDRVEYDDGATFPDPDGEPRSDQSHFDNNVGTHWAEAITSWDGNDKGTRGDSNPAVTQNRRP